MVQCKIVAMVVIEKDFKLFVALRNLLDIGIMS
jgi:hypothetical protein